MSERYRLVVKNGNMHLMMQGSFFDQDCSKLHKTFSGKLATSNLLSTNYELEDVSGWFSSGQKYKLKKSNGEVDQGSAYQ